jgi:serine protease Do
MMIRFHALGLLTLVGAAVVLPAQTRTPRQERDARNPVRTIVSRMMGDPDRARLGVSIESTGIGDTLGVRVADVTEGGPAEKAGIRSGDRITAINGVNLRVSREDAEDESMGGVAQRRLTRELARREAGDTVELRVVRDGAERTVRLATVSAADLEPSLQTASRWKRESADRASLGVGLAGSGSARDTLGVFVTSIAADGPADKAGIEEGDRIVAINGVDLRVPREDAGDWAASNARVRRLSRELEKVKPGDEVELRVLRAGQGRTVKVKTASARDIGRAGLNTWMIGGDEGMRGFSFDGVAPLPPLPPLPPMAPLPPEATVPPDAPRAPRVYWYDDDGRGRIRLQLAPRERIEIRERRPELLQRELRRAPTEVVRPKVRVRVSSAV